MKILFITHETSRTGAPMVLLHLLRWLQQNKPEVQADVLDLRGGAMQEDFRKTSANLFDYKECIKKDKLSILHRLLLRFKLRSTRNKQEELLEHLGKNEYDIVYANTIVTLPMAHSIITKNINTRFVAHIHELDVIIKQLLPNIKDFIPYIHKVIVPAKLVGDNLINNWNFPPRIIETVYECAHNSETVEELAVKKNNFTVGASGVVHWRKGYDVFIQVARYISKNYKDAKIDFVWVGRMDKAIKFIIEEDLRKLGLQESVHFLGEVAQPQANYNAFDVFLMTSREDPFPLVCIELGQLGKPIIGFEQAIGTNEILEKGGGFIVPYLDIEAMAEKVMLYYNDPKLKEVHGAINKIEFSRFTPEIICPKLFEVIEKQL